MALETFQDIYFLYQVTKYARIIFTVSGTSNHQLHEKNALLHLKCTFTARSVS